MADTLAAEIDARLHDSASPARTKIIADVIAAWNLRQAAPVREDAEKWRPISEAPKDGTEILICHQPDGEAEPTYNIVFWDDADIRFPWNFVDGGGAYREAFPTHWQPLPVEPARAAIAAIAAGGGENGSHR